MGDIIVAAAVIGGLGLVFGIGLSYASKVFAVKVDERVSLIGTYFPGKLRSCGFSGCDGMQALWLRKAETNACPVGGSSVAKK